MLPRLYNKETYWIKFWECFFQWKPRRIKSSEHGPRTIRQIHQDAAKDPNFRAPSNRPMQAPQSDFFGPLNGGGMHSQPGWLTSSGMNDIFLQDTMSE